MTTPSTEVLERRIAAYVFDSLTLVVLYVALKVGGVSSAALAVTILGWVYLGALQGLTGVTLGKRITGIRVVRASDGGKPGLLRGLVRYLGFAVDLFPYLLPIVGWVVVAKTPRVQRVGDMLARTLVVRAPRSA
jgi:uncharacterized RDD family membrane protein YckC